MNSVIYDYLPEEAKNIREQVFIIEQGFENEYDEIDETATHIVIFDGDKAVATCRVFKGEEEGTYILGRLAVIKELRHKGIGSLVIKEAEKYVETLGGNCIILHAQLTAKEFYKKAGFTEYGEIEYEQDCPHIWMKKVI